MTSHISSKVGIYVSQSVRLELFKILLHESYSYPRDCSIIKATEWDQMVPVVGRRDMETTQQTGHDYDNLRQ